MRKGRRTRMHAHVRVTCTSASAHKDNSLGKGPLNKLQTREGGQTHALMVFFFNRGLVKLCIYVYTQCVYIYIHIDICVAIDIQPMFPKARQAVRRLHIPLKTVAQANIFAHLTWIRNSPHHKMPPNNARTRKCPRATVRFEPTWLRLRTYTPKLARSTVSLEPKWLRLRTYAPKLARATAGLEPKWLRLRTYISGNPPTPVAVAVAAVAVVVVAVAVW